MEGYDRVSLGNDACVEETMRNKPKPIVSSQQGGFLATVDQQLGSTADGHRRDLYLAPTLPLACLFGV